ncbi:MAG: AgmX/PglI C-terminal domain-containing protein [Myxococcales bacterium]|nr:AgmX/PglI C-terminal domain-containing protein [Myxococcales bacterium]
MSSLQASVRQQMPRLRACYERSLLTNPDLKARLRLTLSVSAAGRVEAAVVSGEGADALKPCLVEAARTFVLPAGEPRQVQVPLVFQTAH